MGKTIHEWFLEAKANGAEWADAAIENTKDCNINANLLSVNAPSLYYAIRYAFGWMDTIEGHEYWIKIANSVKNA